MQQLKIATLVWILAPFVFSFAFGLDIYIPIVPQMAEIFDTTPAMVQLTMSLFLLTTGVGQLFIGPLSDQFGRKASFYCSAAAFMLGSLGCAGSPTIGVLIFCRLISAMGACGMLVTSFALVRDLFSSDKSAKVYSFLNGAIGISPTLAPILGGHLAMLFGWQSVFVFLSLIGCAALVIARSCIQETLPHSQRIVVNAGILRRYLVVFTHRQFILFAMLAGLAESVFFCFFSTSPFIIIDLHGVPTHEFGYYFAAFGLVLSLSGFISGKLIEKVGMLKTIGVGIGLMCMGGLMMLGWYALQELSLAGFLVPMAIACTGATFVVGASAAGALEPFGEIAGTASAAFGTVEFSLAAISGVILMLFPTTTTVPYGLSIVILAAVALLLFTALMQKKRKYS